MKIISRLLLTLPFVLVTFLYLRLQLSANGCRGLIEFVCTIALRILLAVTIIVSFVATVRKRQSQRLIAEPYSLTITLTTIVVLTAGALWGDKLKGEKWIEARSQNYYSQTSAQDIIFRKSGTFTIYLKEADFTCFYTGYYYRTSDRIIFDTVTLGKIPSKIARQYFLKDNVLIPWPDHSMDTKHYVHFDVISTK